MKQKLSKIARKFSFFTFVDNDWDTKFINTIAALKKFPGTPKATQDALQGIIDTHAYLEPCFAERNIKCLLGGFDIVNDWQEIAVARTSGKIQQLLNNMLTVSVEAAEKLKQLARNDGDKIFPIFIDLFDKKIAMIEKYMKTASTA